MATELRSLRKRERQLLRSLEGVRHFVQHYEEARDGGQVSLRMQGLEEVHKEYFAVRSKLELLVEDAELTKHADSDPDVKQEVLEHLDNENDRVLQEFEDHFYALKASMLTLLPNFLPPLQLGGHQSSIAGDDGSGTHQVATFSKVKLPEIRLPSFSGKIFEWVTFRDSFQSLIHRNPQLTDMDKFTYLRSSLSGDALQEISSVGLSAANYIVAWEILENRYENKKLIVKAHLDALFAIEGLKRESYDKLNQLISDFEKNLQMLDKIGQNTSEWTTILAYMVCSKLDSITLRQRETHHNAKEVPTYAALLSFLRNHCDVLQSVAPAKSQTIDHRSSKSTVCHTVVKTSNRCTLCSESWHPPSQCAMFQRMKVSERIEAVAKHRLCRNCLRPGHYSSSCERGVCRHCQQKHHSMLHGAPKSSVPHSQPKPPSQDTQPRQSQTKQHNPNQHIHTNTANSQRTNNTQPTTTTPTTSQNYVALPITPTHNILLSTALVTIKDRFGRTTLARALLDSCSQHCLMTASFANKLQFHESPTYLSVQGIGSSRSVSTKLISAEVSPRSRIISSFTEEMQFHVLPKLTVLLPTTSCNPAEWDLPDSTLIADPGFHEPGPVDLIIGAEYYMDLLKNERQRATPSGPTLQNTVFGWILSGRIPNSSSGGPCSLVHVCSTAEVEEQLTKFWDLETCRTTSINSVEESSCEQFFEQTTVRDESGRFVVTLPKKEHVISKLGDSKAIALKRFMGLERRFAANPDLKTVYSEFIHEYLTLGHMKEVIEDIDGGKKYYLPHHAVLKPDSTTTKLRVVFDASCRTSTGISLNDGLMVGPVVQEDLLSITLRFRTHRFAIVADIAKMYRMVRVQVADQSLQRILWRDSIEEPIRTFELTTVTYGTASAPYLATKCLRSLAEEGAEMHPEAAKVLKKDFYVDDMLSGVDDVEDGKKLIQQLVELLESARFSLRKWNSNNRELLLNVPEHLRDDRSILELDSSSSTIKTLGLVWEPSTDRFRFTTPVWSSAAVITKRTVLSDVSRLFDPLGLVGPVIIQAKIFIQELWKQECSWDEPLTAELQENWHEYRRNLAGLDSLSVPRWVGSISSSAAVEIHGFCDASELAYGACVYIRTVTEAGSVAVRLLTSKSRVAPLENLKKKKKRQSIPRLELSSALLLAHLYEKVVQSLRISAKSFFWTDSMIVKCWLSSSPSRWKQFVANRVSEIQHITKDGTWNHVAGVENPADIISRGMTPAQLQYQHAWFDGPHWLLLEEAYRPEIKEIWEENIESADLEEKSTTLVLQTTTPSEIFKLRSSLSELVRITAYIRRFRFNARAVNRNCRRHSPITTSELDEALQMLVRLAQQESFPQELADLSKQPHVRDSSRIISLKPILKEGILCVGGRLRHAAVSTNRKHPYILDPHHPLTKIVVVYYHRKLFHAGQQLLISAMREQFWPVYTRNLVRQVIHECVACFRVRPKAQDQIMADLPPERVTPYSPFRRVGVDYCGPFSLVYPHRRCQPVKCFVAVYVCLVTKAVHLEIVSDLTTQAFLASLKRFTSRRGRPDLIMCDNAKNFVGAKRELDELRRLFHSQQFQNAVTKEAANDKIEFRFIPARSPNFGGLWESAVKSFKTLFKRSIGLHTLVYDEMQTVLVQIEAILNSRPLTPVSNDPDDYEALTPGHFLVQRPLTAIPEPDLEAIPENRLSAWQKTQRFTQHLWKKWSTQYLSNLHNRTKWTRQRDNIRVGTMVVLKEENLPPLKWQLARVTEIQQGPDQNVRVVKVQTKDGSYKRAISKICVLPIRDNFISSTEEN
ncbi:uncharacterized protein LOC131687365 [Topomyia yanbarensis]|uniref:uncharacterized protein LOC131687365 n=1 Tax=Topomyia yanbarensis TaxID=2498891 RepID=UPI00273B1AAB|nr:uncharacterized protein LOC131687365 [Topomyia yanbarensis]